MLELFSKQYPDLQLEMVRVIIKGGVWKNTEVN